MKALIVALGLSGVLYAGCVSKSELKAKQRQAFLAGQKQGAVVAQANANSVWIVGNVRNPSVPWTPELTLRQALIEADVQGAGDPSQIVVLRNGGQPTSVSAQELLNGFDMPLQAGDRVEVRR
ncbi:MAG TPA: hypothetical protein VG754_06225 [Verrucomicrobiae bacterium]|nr:hypothetical protein [Verrucomicrobiae bacterium]